MWQRRTKIRSARRTETHTDFSNFSNPVSVFYEGVIFFLGWKVVETVWYTAERRLRLSGWISTRKPIWPRKRKSLAEIIKILKPKEEEDSAGA